MKKHVYLLLFLVMGFFSSPLVAQLPNGSTAPDWTLTDINGTEWNLYSILDQGKTVIIDFSATWCPPCWNYHNSGNLENFYDTYGPDGTDEAMVFFIEPDASTNTGCLYNSGCNSSTQGNWVQGTPYPIIDLNSSEANQIGSDYQIPYYPTIYAICPNRTIYLAGQASTSQLANYIQSCSLTAEVESINNGTCLDPEGSIDISVSGGVPPISYSWSNGASGEDIDGLSPGIYSCTITEGNGIIFTLSDIEITQNSQPIEAYLTGSEDVSCNGANDAFLTVSASGGNGALSFLWSNGVTESSLYDISGGEYTVTITDEGGCIYEETFTVEEPDAISIEPSITNSTCGMSNGVIDASVYGGTAPTTVLINGDSYPGGYASGLSAGSYTIVATDANGCTNTETVTVGDDSGATVSINSNAPALDCATTTVVLTASTSGAGTYQYAWTYDGMQIGSDAMLSITEAGTYTVTMTDDMGCSSNESITVTEVNNAPNANAGNDAELSCTITSLSLDGSGSTVGITYNWTTSNGVIESGANTPSPIISAPGTYTLTVTNAAGCTASDDVVVNANDDLPTASISASNNLDCNNNSVMLDSQGSTPGTMLTWSDSNGNVIGNQSTATVSEAGTYTLNVTNTSTGCMTTTSYVVEDMTAAPSITLGDAPVITCTATNVVINASTDAADAGYAWSTTDGNIVEGNNEAEATVDQAGTYSITVTNSATGCQSTSSIEVTENINTPVSSFTSTQSELMTTFTNNSQGENLTYAWSFGDGMSSDDPSPSHTYAASGDYEVCLTVTNECGSNMTCTTVTVSTTTVSISVTSEVTMPSCNGDQTGAIDQTISDESVVSSYAWTTGADTQDISGLGAGTYTCVITLSDGSETTLEYTIAEPDAITVDAMVDGSNIDVTVGGGVPPYTYVWSNGATEEDPRDLDNGTYTLEVTDSNGCTYQTDGIVVQVDATIDVDATEFVNIFPNPVTHDLQIEVKTNALGDYTVEIYTMVGRKIITKQYQSAQGSASIDMSHIQNGNYIVVIRTSEDVYQKIISKM